MPIPANGSESLTTYEAILGIRGHSLAKVINDLGGPMPAAKTHLDPDLRRSMLARDPDWRPLFGQAGIAASHLRNSDVRDGDLFLFFGWFKQTEIHNGRYRYVRGARDLHVIFGWLQVGEIFPAGTKNHRNVPGWARYHPHFHNDWDEPNTVHVARKYLSIPGLDRRLAGGGVIEHFANAHILTAPGCSRSVWKLPGAIYPRHGKPLLTYHKNPNCWSREGANTILRTQAKGQEFILNTNECPNAISWAREILAQAS